MEKSEQQAAAAPAPKKSWESIYNLKIEDSSSSDESCGDDGYYNEDDYVDFHRHHYDDDDDEEDYYDEDCGYGCGCDEDEYCDEEDDEEYIHSENFGKEEGVSDEEESCHSPPPTSPRQPLKPFKLDPHAVESMNQRNKDWRGVYNLQLSDDSDEDEKLPSSFPQPSLRETLRSNVFPSVPDTENYDPGEDHSSSSKTPASVWLKKANWIREHDVQIKTAMLNQTPIRIHQINVHPKDSLNRLSPYLFFPVQEFVDTCLSRKRIETHLEGGTLTPRFQWGVASDDSETNAENMINTMMMTQSLYSFMSIDGIKKHPEAQYVDQLIKLKKAALKSTRFVEPNVDLILKITLFEYAKGQTPEYQDLVWRRIKVGSNVKLHTFHDKILGPVMGWARNYHAYIFTETNDGAMYGPKDSGAVDMMHLHMNGHEFIDSGSVKLGQLLFEAGQTISYVYDLGDYFMHRIEVEKVLHNSNGHVEVLGGEKACPPEDNNGVEDHDYAALLQNWKDFTREEKRRVQYEARSAMNYQNSSRPFNPHHFDIKECQKQVRAAIGSKNSVRGGEKKIVTNFNRPGSNDSMMFGKEPRRGERTVKKYVDKQDCGCCNPNVTMQERVSKAKDSRADSLCTVCGSANNLKRCNTCRQTIYCSRECQRKDWKSGHKEKCKAHQKSKRSSHHHHHPRQ